MPSLRRVAPPVFKDQPDATIDQENPVSGQKYEWSSDGTQAKKLGTQKNVRVISIWCRIGQATAGTITSMTMTMTIDGNTRTAVIAPPTAATSYVIIISSSTENFAFAGDTPVDRSFLTEGRSVKIEVEVAWTEQPSPLEARVKYAKME